MRNLYTYILFFLIIPAVWSQKTQVSPSVLDTVHLTDFKRQLLPADSLYIVPDTTVRTSLTVNEILFERSSFAIREYGRGMIAGVSIRGSSSAHVQTLWNGIPLNSPLSGQADLNLYDPVFDKVTVIKGGKSAFYGSGSMAGNIILENDIRFTPQSRIDLHYTTGQTKLFRPFFKMRFSNRRQYIQASVAYTDDKNIYQPPRWDDWYVQARILRHTLSLDYAGKLNDWTVSFHYLRADADRYLPTLPTIPNQSRLVMTQDNYALKINRPAGKHQWEFTLGYHHDTYEFYYKIDYTQPGGAGDAHTMMAKTAYRHVLSSRWNIFAEAEYLHTRGMTLNYPMHTLRRGILSGGINGKTRKWEGHFILRQNLLSSYQLPPSVSAMTGFRINPSHRFYTSLTYNNRIPSFNDLYWQPGGNPELKPEKGWENEWSYIFSKKSIYSRLSVFYKHTYDLIRWYPQADGLWSPVNLDRVEAKGIEWGWKWHRKRPFAEWTISTETTYQHVIDLETGKPLTYTPALNSFISAEIRRKSLQVFYSFRYQDHYYTDPDQLRIIYGHWLHSAGVGYELAGLQMEFQLKNIFNQYYELMPGYPMPGREWRWKIIYKINKHQDYEKIHF